MGYVHRGAVRCSYTNTPYIYRVSTVYLPYIYRISTVIDSRETTQKCVETREGEFLVHFFGHKKTYKVDI